MRNEDSVRYWMTKVFLLSRLHILVYKREYSQRTFRRHHDGEQIFILHGMLYFEVYISRTLANMSQEIRMLDFFTTRMHWAIKVLCCKWIQGTGVIRRFTTWLLSRRNGCYVSPSITIVGLCWVYFRRTPPRREQWANGSVLNGGARGDKLCLGRWVWVQLFACMRVGIYIL